MTPPVSCVRERIYRVTDRADACLQCPFQQPSEHKGQLSVRRSCSRELRSSREVTAGHAHPGMSPPGVSSRSVRETRAVTSLPAWLAVEPVNIIVWVLCLWGCCWGRQHRAGWVQAMSGGSVAGSPLG